MKKTTRLISALLAALLLFTLQLADLPVGFAASSPYAIICDNCEALNESLDVIRSACPGDKVFVRFRRQDMPDGKYTTQDIISDDVTYKLFIQSSSGGKVSYNDINISNGSQSFTVKKGSPVLLSISPTFWKRS